MKKGIKTEEWRKHFIRLWDGRKKEDKRQKKRKRKKRLDGESLKIQEIEGQYSYSDLIFRPS